MHKEADAVHCKMPKLGCPWNDTRAETFLKVARYLEDNDNEQMTISDLINLMNQIYQYGADIIDHNICTLEGHDTFHGMGMIFVITPKTSLGQSIPRAKVTSLDVAAVGRVQVHFHKEKRHECLL